MDLSANALTTLKRVQDHLTVSDLSEVDNLIWLINAASDRIESECNRSFGECAHTFEPYVGDGRRLLLLEQYPVINVQEVAIDGVVVADFSIDKKAGLLYRELRWDKSANIAATYVAGYVLPRDEKAATETEPAVVRTLPYDLEAACVLLVAQAYQTRGSEHLSTEVVGPLRSEFLKDIPAVTNTIDKYRRVVL